MLKTVPNMAGLKVSCAEDMEQEESDECEGTGELVWLPIGNRCQDKDVSRGAKQIPRQRKARKNTGQSTSAAHLHTVLLRCHQEKSDEETTNSCIYI